MQHGPAASSGSNPKAPGSAGGYLLSNLTDQITSEWMVSARLPQMFRRRLVVTSRLRRERWLLVFAPMH
jgi:hypothetical protein